MPALNIPSIPAGPQASPDPILRFAVELAARLARVGESDVVQVLVETLDEICTVADVDGCHLIEFSEAGRVSATYGSANTSDVPAVDSERGLLEDWLTESLARGERVVTVLARELPTEAVFSRELVKTTGACSILGLPALAGDGVTCALVVYTCRSSRHWDQASIDRLQVLTEIFGAALRARRHEIALRASESAIAELKARLQAGTAYLNDEIKGYHDFEDIV